MSYSYSLNPASFFATKNNLCNLSDTEWETLEILFDIEQFQMLLTSMEEARLGQVVTFAQAFGDLD